MTAARTLGAFVAAVVVLHSAHAQEAITSSTSDPELVLRWKAPVTCPDAVAVRQRMRELRGSRSTPAVAVTAQGEVTVDEQQRWHLLLTTEREGSRGERVLDAPSCHALAESAALILALADRPFDGSKGADESPPTTARSAPPPEPPGVVFGVQGGLDLGLIAAIRPLMTVMFGWRSRYVRAEAFVMGAFAQAVTRLDQAAPTDHFSLLTWGIQACPVLPYRTFAFGFCGGVETGSLARPALANVDASSDAQAFIALHAGPLVTWHVAGPLFLRANFDAVVPLTRARFSFPGLDSDGYANGEAAPRVLFGAEAHF